MSIWDAVAKLAKELLGESSPSTRAQNFSKVGDEVIPERGATQRKRYTSEPDHLADIEVLPEYELILRAVQGPEQAENPLIQQLMLEEIAALENLPLHIPMPQDRRLQAICRTLIQTPDHPHTLEDWAQQVGASNRSGLRG